MPEGYLLPPCHTGWGGGQLPRCSRGYGALGSTCDSVMPTPYIVIPRADQVTMSFWLRVDSILVHGRGSTENCL